MRARASITETLCEKILEDVLSGALAPGERLDANAIAAAGRVSPTPVRCALNRLAGAGFLIAHAKEGFFTPRWTEGDLRDAYESIEALLGLAVSQLDAGKRPEPGKTEAAAGKRAAPALQTELLFREIMMFCGNRRLMRSFDNINMQLRPVRLLEPRWIRDAPAELDRLQSAFAVGDGVNLGARIGAYHRRRLRLVRKIATHLDSLNSDAAHRLF